MKYNFDEIVPRRNSNSYKWDTALEEDVLPMWVADMDFRTAAPIIEALQKRVQHGIFGYTKVPDEYFAAVSNWFLRRHGFDYKAEWTLYTTGVVPAVSAIIKALTMPGDRVIVQTPVYNCFFSSIRNNDCEILANNLIYKNNTYSIDFDDLERKAADDRAKIFLLCSPHNPAGRVWKREELVRIGEICLKNNVIVVSDEIHCDLVFAKHRHIPFASLGERFLQGSVTCTAPSKTFNIAGLKVANIHAADENIRKKIDKALNINEVCEISPFAIDALIAAYNYGEDWLEQLKNYLFHNYLYVRNFFDAHLPQYPVTTLEATYLVWIDCMAMKKNSSELAQTMLEKENLLINAGTMYGSGGENFIRLNIACPRSTLIEGLNKIQRVFCIRGS